MKRKEISVGLLSLLLSISMISTTQAQETQSIEELLLEIESNLELAAEAAETSTDPTTTEALLEAIQETSDDINGDLNDMASITDGTNQELIVETTESLDETYGYVADALNVVSEAIEYGEDTVEIEIETQVEKDPALTPAKRKTWRARQAERQQRHLENLRNRLSNNGLSTEEIDDFVVEQELAREEIQTIREQVRNGELPNEAAKARIKTAKKELREIRKEIREITAEIFIASVAETNPEKADEIKAKRKKNQNFINEMEKKVQAGTMTEEDAKAAIKAEQEKNREAAKAEREKNRTLRKRKQDSRIQKIEAVNPKKAAEIRAKRAEIQDAEDAINEKVEAGEISQEEAKEAKKEIQTAEIKAQREIREEINNANEAIREEKLDMIEEINPVKAAEINAIIEENRAAQEVINEEVESGEMTKTEATEAEQEMKESRKIAENAENGERKKFKAQKASAEKAAAIKARIQANQNSE